MGLTFLIIQVFFPYLNKCTVCLNLIKIRASIRSPVFDISITGKRMEVLILIILSMSLQETSLQLLEKYKKFNKIYLSQPQELICHLLSKPIYQTLWRYFGDLVRLPQF